jgi:hypothetical protein
MRLLKLVLPLVILLFGVGNSIAQKDSDITAFWRTFRQAALTSNYDRVASVTRFPFEVRGPDDSDPIKHYNRKAFPVIFKRVLSQPLSLTSEGRIITKSMLEVIEYKTEIIPTDYLTPSIIRVNQLQFTRIDDHWLFTRAYLEEY